MNDPEEITDIRLHPQVTESVSLAIPVNTLELVQRAAANRDMSPEALLKFYIGQGLRQDAARLYVEEEQGAGPSSLSAEADSVQL